MPPLLIELGLWDLVRIVFIPQIEILYKQKTFNKLSLSNYDSNTYVMFLWKFITYIIILYIIHKLKNGKYALSRNETLYYKFGNKADIMYTTIFFFYFTEEDPMGCRIR